MCLRLAWRQRFLRVMTSRICFAHVERPRDNLFQFPLGNREPNLPNPYMLFSMSFVLSFRFFRRRLGLMSLGGQWNDGERSEPRATARQGTSGGTSRFSQPTPRPSDTKCCPRRAISAFLAHARNDIGVPAQRTPAVRASSFNPRMAFGQSVAQLEPRAPFDPNSNRCLSGGSGHQLACIRMSQSIVTVR